MRWKKTISFHVGHQKWVVYYVKNLHGRDYDVSFIAATEEEANSPRYDELAEIAFRRSERMDFGGGQEEWLPCANRYEHPFLMLCLARLFGEPIQMIDGSFRFKGYRWLGEMYFTHYLRSRDGG